MKANRHTLSDFVNGLQRSARYVFSRAEAADALGFRGDALTKALQRLTGSRRICQVQRGFYVVVPMEYASSGAPPVDWFIDDLMQYIGQPYYAGVLTAAALHGAAHQRPQEYHVVIPVSRRAIRARGSRIRFFRRADVGQVQTEPRQTYTGSIPVSSPECTALDLVRFSKSIGGLDAVLTVLGELGERISPEKLSSAAQSESLRGIVQRLGWLLDRAGWEKHTSPLAAWLAGVRPSRTVLNASIPTRRGRLCRKWQVIENDQPTGEL
jgi:predicted transcriptional regulator of viral defense system